MGSASWGTTKIEHGLSERVVLAIYEERIRPVVDPDGTVHDVPEAEFTSATIELAQWYGWRVTHFRPGRTASGWETCVQGDGKGFPDLFGLHEEHRWRFTAELKCNKNKPSREQHEWLHAMEVCGVPAFTWWPRSLDEILWVLKHGPDGTEAE